jgi:hypothetical protein
LHFVSFSFLFCPTNISATDEMLQTNFLPNSKVSKRKIDREIKNEKIEGEGEG